MEDKNSNGVDDSLEYKVMIIVPLAMIVFGFIGVAASEYFKLENTRNLSANISTGGMALLGVARKR